MTTQLMRTQDGYIRVPEIVMPITNAKNTTIVEMKDNKLKMRIEKRGLTAQELIE